MPSYAGGMDVHPDDRSTAGGGEGGPSFISRLRQARLTEAEQAVAGFYQDRLAGAAMMEVAEVCAEVGTSAATVSRFARKLGYSDFRSMRQDLRRYADGTQDTPAHRLLAGAHEDDAQGVLHRRLGIAVGDLQASSRSLDATVFEKVADLLADENRRLHLAAVASGRPVMRYFATLLGYLRGNVVLLDGPDVWAHAAAGIDSDSVVMVSVFDRSPAPVAALIETASEAGASTVMVTNRPGGPLTAEVDHLLAITSQSSPMFRSRVPLMAVLEALLDAICVRVEGADERAGRIEEFFERAGSYVTS